MLSSFLSLPLGPGEKLLAPSIHYCMDLSEDLRGKHDSESWKGGGGRGGEGFHSETCNVGRSLSKSITRLF